MPKIKEIREAVRLADIAKAKALVRKANSTTLCAKGDHGETVLHSIVSGAWLDEDHIQLIQLLIKKGGADLLNATDKRGRTALHVAYQIASESSNKAALKELLDSNASVDIRANDGASVTDLAAYASQVKIFALFFKRKGEEVLDGLLRSAHIYGDSDFVDSVFLTLPIKPAALKTSQNPVATETEKAEIVETPQNAFSDLQCEPGVTARMFFMYMHGVIENMSGSDKLEAESDFIALKKAIQEGNRAHINDAIDALGLQNGELVGIQRDELFEVCEKLKALVNSCEEDSFIQVLQDANNLHTKYCWDRQGSQLDTSFITNIKRQLATEASASEKDSASLSSSESLEDADANIAVPDDGKNLRNPRRASKSLFKMFKLQRTSNSSKGSGAERLVDGYPPQTTSP